RIAIVNIGVDFYGGIASILNYKGWSLDVLAQFVKQRGYSPEYYGKLFGGMFNQPVGMVDYWRPENTTANHQLPTTGKNNAAVQAAQHYKLSNGVFTNTSFFRLKNIQLAYNFSLNQNEKTQLKFFFQGQNLLTFTPYKGLDPETSGNYLPA